MSLRHLRPALCAAAFLLGPAAFAGGPEASDAVEVEASDVGEKSGRIAFNAAAGTNNQQAGSAVLAMGQRAEVAGTLHQRLEDGWTGDRSTSITIGARAFADIHGLGSVNVTAGRANQSANMALVAIGAAAALADYQLAQTRAPFEPDGGPGEAADARNDSIQLDGTAFQGGSGLLQVNLIGGERNSSANTFVLSVPGSGNP